MDSKTCDIIGQKIHLYLTDPFTILELQIPETAYNSAASW